VSTDNQASSPQSCLFVVFAVSFDEPGHINGHSGTFECAFVSQANPGPLNMGIKATLLSRDHPTSYHQPTQSTPMSLNRDRLTTAAVAAAVIGCWISYKIGASTASTAKASIEDGDQVEDGALDVSPNRQSITLRTQRNQGEFVRDLIWRPHHRLCSCDQCAPRLYFNCPLSCDTNHLREDLQVLPRERAELVSEFDRGFYEALHLARRTIEYFSRPEIEMDREQRQFVDKFRDSEWRQPLIDALNQEDTRFDCDDSHIRRAIICFDQIFFFGALEEIRWEWNNTDLEEEGGLLGQASRENSPFEDGSQRSVILLHPTRTRFLAKEYDTANGQSIAGERLGTILHEMLHAYLTQHACMECHLGMVNGGHSGHGRAWQLVAKAIEEQSLRLLNIEVDLNRLRSLERNSKDKTSIHDLEVYGFIGRVTPDLYGSDRT